MYHFSLISVTNKNTKTFTSSVHAKTFCELFSKMFSDHALD